MLVHPNSPPNDMKMNGLHIWCLPYLDDILIVTLDMQDCERKLRRAMTALKVQKTAPNTPICPLAMGEHIPFMIAETHLKGKGEAECNKCCSCYGREERSLNTKQGVPSFTDSEPIPWDLFLKYGQVVPPPKRSQEARARHSQEKVSKMLNKTMAECPKYGINPVEVKDLEEAVRKSLKAIYTKKRKDTNNKKHPTGWSS